MRFYNSGEYDHESIDRETGERKVQKRGLHPKAPLAEGSKEHAPAGTAIVSFPGSNIHRHLAKGEFIDLPDEISVAAVKNACPALVTEEEAVNLGLAKKQEPVVPVSHPPAAKPVKGKE